MPCFRPLKLARDKRTAVALNVPCGRCIGCKLEHSRQWAVRCMHEASCHEANSFVTLTFEDSKLPADGVSVRDLQLFFKRLRKQFRFRYYACGEYGERFARPHYHALLFGVDFADKVRVQDSPSGSRQWVSPLLDATWQQGLCTIGTVTFESAAYVSRYVTKKVTGEAASSHYEVISPLTGEVHRLNPEFGTMSRRPGIGRGWFQKFAGDVFPSDEVVARGHASKPPRYYDKLHEELSVPSAEAVRRERALRRRRLSEETPARLSVREKCATARVNLHSRSLEL